MADVSKFSLYGTSYNIKDLSARSSAASANQAAASASQAAFAAKTLADSALSNSETNETNITNLASESLKASYTVATETIEITKGIQFSKGV